MSGEAIRIDPDDLSDDTLLALLAAMQRELPAIVTEPPTDRGRRLLAAGMAVAGEAWRRRLIAPADPTG